MKRALCRLAGLALILPALTSSLIVAMLVGTADERIGKDRFYLHCFEAAAGVRPLPPMHLARAADRFGPAYAQCPAISERPSLDPEDADVEDRIARQPHDRLWGFWRGEWKEYFVSPSGGTSLLATKMLYWRAFAPQILVYLLISGVCIVAARRIWLRSSQSIPGTSSVSGT